MMINKKKMKMLSGMRRFPCKGGGCRHADSGWFLYWDEDEYRMVFECEDDPDGHDFEVSGKWGDGSPIGGMRLVVEKWKREEHGRSRSGAARTRGR